MGTTFRRQAGDRGPGWSRSSRRPGLPRTTTALVLSVLCAACGSAASSPVLPSAAVATSTPLPSRADPSGKPTAPAPSPTAPIGYGAVLTDLRAPGTLTTTTGAAITPDLMKPLWNIAASVNPFAGTIKKLPKVTHLEGSEVLDIKLPTVWDARLVLALNDDGTVRAAAVTTPSGGLDMGVQSPYIIVDVIYDNLVVALTGDREGAVHDDLGLGAALDDGSVRVDVDRAATSPPYRFRFVTTPDKGDWFIATAEHP
jgi:hypothetical protein